MHYLPHTIKAVNTFFAGYLVSIRVKEEYGYECRFIIITQTNCLQWKRFETFLIPPDSCCMHNKDTNLYTGQLNIITALVNQSPHPQELCLNCWDNRPRKCVMQVWAVWPTEWVSEWEREEENQLANLCSAAQFPQLNRNYSKKKIRTFHYCLISNWYCTLSLHCIMHMDI